jgi:hypothetical protein
VELVTIDQVQPGHVVAAAVTNAAGARLCPAGFKLTETAIERLRNAGVEAVVIEGTIKRGPSAADRLAALEERFHGIDDPVMLQLKATIENRLNAMIL